MKVSLKAILCGLTVLAFVPVAQAQVSQRIVGGSDAQIEDYPYQVFIQTQVGNQFFGCGGSIRDTTHVITAAHCVMDESGGYPEVLSPSDAVVAYGSDDLANVPPDQVVGVSSIAVDRRYLRRLTGSEYDSAVLELSEPIVESSSARPIPLADASLDAAFLEAGDPATVTGFGATSENGNTSNVLQAVEVRLVDDPFCAGRYGSEFVAPAMVCAGDTNAGGKDSCQGDSGGPLAVDTDPADATRAFKLAGIVSFGTGCARREFPGVYTEVTESATRAFLLADSPSPPAVSAADPAITPGTPQEGSTVTCDTPAGFGEATQFFFYGVTSSGTYTGLASGSSPTLAVPAAAVGQRLACDVRYENAGGFAYATDKTPSAPVTAAPLPMSTTPPTMSTTPPTVFDRTRPRSRITRIRCPGRVCIVSISASDTKPGAVKSLIVTLARTRTTCRGRGARRTCRRVRITKRLRAGAFGGGRYRVVAGRLAPRRYRITVVATDTAGNRQAKAATRLFRVKRTPPR